LLFSEAAFGALAFGVHVQRVDDVATYQREQGEDDDAARA
jgi:hypothetical protein